MQAHSGSVCVPELVQHVASVERHCCSLPPGALFYWLVFKNNFSSIFLLPPISCHFSYFPQTPFRGKHLKLLEVYSSKQLCDNYSPW